ncbi:hypothetical protein GLUCOINTEAF2_0200646 [Komagataeibacter intermedius AF2]|uniref:Uncharacterized protein n=1 Tax=Komagataeibacter intermedius AF2 TaxID=1458464 RepID=A0A0N1FBB8_9PROT|nr:hypothetical protein GLUCOINTEAF2_0200646 [Komagataeibacter intermedius AF2]
MEIMPSLRPAGWTTEREMGKRGLYAATVQVLADILNET